MRNLKQVGALAAAGVVALAVSGCYAFSGLTISKSALKPGQSSAVTATAYSGSGQADKDVFFLLVALPNNFTGGDTSDDPLVARAGKFDTKGVIYRKPKALTADTAIRDALVANGGCGTFDFSDAPTDRFVVLATANRVKQTAAKRQVTSTYKLKQIREATENINPQAMITAVGFWDDDGDNVPEPGGIGELNCTGGAIHNINVKIINAARAASKGEIIERYSGVVD
jgi:hypothetical protein